MFDLDFLKNKRKNVFIIQKRIPLGFNTSYKHKLEYYGEGDAIFCISEQWLGILTLLSAHSSGKSVLMKRIACYWAWIWKNRPGIIFDMQGLDWRTIRNKGKEGLIFKQQGEEYWGFGDRLKNFTPMYLSHYIPKNSKLHDDVIFGICWKDLNILEWDFLLGEATEAVTWVYKFKNYITNFKDNISSLKYFISESESTLKNLMKGKRGGEGYSKHIPEYMGVVELMSMIGTLKPLLQSNFLLEEHDTRRLDIIKELKHGKILNFSFWGDKSVKSNIYTANIMRKVREHYLHIFNQNYPNIPNTPFIIWEEADLAAPAGQKSLSGDQMAELITKEMKVGYKFAIISQMLKRMNKQVRDALIRDPILLARPVPDDIKLISAGRRNIERLLYSLDLKRDKYNTLEWCYLEDSGQTMRTFRPAASPCEFVQRFKDEIPT